MFAEEMSIKWDLSFTPPASSLGAFMKGINEPSNSAGKKNEGDVGSGDMRSTITTTAFESEKQQHIINTPRKHSLIEIGEKSDVSELL